MSVLKKILIVYSHTQYTRMTFIADYLKWYAEILIKNQLNKIDKNDINSIQKRIKGLRPKKRSHSNIDRDEKRLEPTFVDQVMEVLKSSYEKNFFKNPDIQIRNALIMVLLCFLGIRQGELLNLQVEDINLISNKVNIYLRPDSFKYPRHDLASCFNVPCQLTTRCRKIERIR